LFIPIIKLRSSIIYKFSGFHGSFWSTDGLLGSAQCRGSLFWHLRLAYWVHLQGCWIVSSGFWSDTRKKCVHCIEQFEGV
jgi:hypothetical protein